MTTHKSRYTQFVIFFVSSWRSEFPDVFLSYLVRFFASCPSLWPNPPRLRFTFSWTPKRACFSVNPQPRILLAPSVVRFIFFNFFFFTCCVKTSPLHTVGSKRVSIDATMRCLDLMFQWAHSYIDHIEESVVVPDQARFGLFYYVCQAMFYIFCFRHRQLMAMSSTFFVSFSLEVIYGCFPLRWHRVLPGSWF